MKTSKILRKLPKQLIKNSMQQNLDRQKIRVYNKITKQITDYDIGSFVLTEEVSIEYFKKNCIMQFSTGLKDKNGVLIFEGDVLQFSNPNIKSVVYFDDLTCSMQMQHMNKDMFYGKGMYRLTRNIVRGVTILGNRFKNPELLEKI